MRYRGNWIKRPKRRWFPLSATRYRITIDGDRNYRKDY